MSCVVRSGARKFGYEWLRGRRHASQDAPGPGTAGSSRGRVTRAPEGPEIAPQDGPDGTGGAVGPGAAGRSTFADVFAVGEFRALWAAQVLSVGGDQLARVALTLLVFDRTRSALLAAVTFAVSVLPTFLGGLTLAGLADRFPRRQVMIASDAIRAMLVVLMIVPGMPLGALVALLFVVTLVGAPFTSARAALYADILTGERYVLGTAVTVTTLEMAQVAGFAVGGVVVGVFGVTTSLVADAATFLISAAITQMWVRSRPAADPAARQRVLSMSDVWHGCRLVFTAPALRTPMLLGWLAAFVDVPEGVAAPLAASLDAGAAVVGVLLAAGAFGATVGAIAFSRLVGPERRLRWMGPLAVASCAVLVCFAARPGLPAAVAILTVGGMLSCYQVAASAAFVRAAPPGQRGQAFGIAQGGMSLGQGLAMIVAGAAVQQHGHVTPAVAIAASGALGAVAGLLILASARRPRGPAGQGGCPAAR